MKLNSKIFGDKSDDLIIIHGLFGCGDNWNMIGKRLSAFWRVHLLDLRNHGRSPHSDLFNYEVMSEDIMSYCINNNIQNPIILGHSLGGKVAMNFAFQYPKKVKKIIIGDIAPKKYPIHFHKQILKTIIDLDMKKFKSRKEVESALSNNIENPSVRLFIMKNLYRLENREFGWRLNVEMLCKNIDKINDFCLLSGVCQVPIHFIRGSRSDYITDEDIQNISNYFSSVSFATIADAGHWLHADQPELFYNEVLRFCNTQ